MICRQVVAKLQGQMMGQLPAERTTMDLIFDRVGVHYAGPKQLKLGSTCKHVLVMLYVCVFVSLSIRVVHLELISDLEYRCIHRISPEVCVQKEEGSQHSSGVTTAQALLVLPASSENK